MGDLKIYTWVEDLLSLGKPTEPTGCTEQVVANL